MADVSVSTSIISNCNNRGSLPVTPPDNKSIAGALSSGEFPTAVNQTQKDDTKAKRQKFLDKIIKDYELKQEDLYNFIKKSLGYSREEFCNLDDDTFNKSLGLIETAIEFIVTSQNKNAVNISVEAKFERASILINQMLNDGSSFDEAQNLIEILGDSGIFDKEVGLLDILKMRAPNKFCNYNNLADVPEDVLNEYMDDFVKTLMENPQKYGQTMSKFKAVLERTSDEDYKIVYEAFIKAAKKDEHLNLLLGMVEKFKDPQVFEDFLTNELPGICNRCGLPIESVQKILRQIAKTASETGLDSKDLLVNLYNVFSPEGTNNALMKKIQSGEELTPEEQKLYDDYKRYKEILNKQAKGEVLVKSDKEFLNTYKEKVDNIRAAIFAALSGENPNKTEELYKVALELGISRDSIIKQVIEFKNKFDDYKIDEKLFDSLTEGKYTQALSEYRESEAKNASSADIGFEQQSTLAEFQASAEKLGVLKTEWTESQLKPEIVIESKDQTNKTEPQITLDNAISSFSYFMVGLKQKTITVEQAGDNFKDAVSSVRDFVLNSLHGQSDLRIIQWVNNRRNNSALAESVTSRFNLGKDAIGKFNISGTRKAVMFTDCEKAHKSEEKS